MLKIILIVVVVLILLFLVIVAIQPSDFRVTRSMNIAAPADVVFAQVNDLHKMDAWSPWLEPDPAVRKTFEGPQSGTGTVFTWSGNNQVGEGRLTIIESHSYDLIRIKLDFIKPFATTNTAEFTFKPDGDETTVTWSLFGKRPFVGKAICLFMNLDKMIGGNFEKGLANVKAIAESVAKN